MKQTAVIVAHPDDEIIWCGGLILRNPDWDWTVFCLCRANDRDREPKFRNICQRLDVFGCISDLDDGNPLVPINPIREIGRRIREHLPEADWDLCLTHGANGEYGHKRHREIHGEVMRLADIGVLRCRELWTFAYKCDARTGACRPMSDADVLVPLTDEELLLKRQIIQTQYGYAPDGFESRACISPEAFHRQPVAAEE